MKKFAIYYNNGDIVYGGGEDDEEITLTFSRKWLEAPSDGVAAIQVESFELGRYSVDSQEYYYMLPLEHHGEGDIGGSLKIGPYLRQLSDYGGIVKFGGWTDSTHYKEIKARAMKDGYLMPQTNTRRPHDEDEAD